MFGRLPDERHTNMQSYDVMLNKQFFFFVILYFVKYAFLFVCSALVFRDYILHCTLRLQTE